MIRAIHLLPDAVVAIRIRAEQDPQPPQISCCIVGSQRVASFAWINP
jgi:hypothetical protein